MMAQKQPIINHIPGIVDWWAEQQICQPQAMVHSSNTRLGMRQPFRDHLQIQSRGLVTIAKVVCTDVTELAN